MSGRKELICWRIMRGKVRGCHLPRGKWEVYETED